jgi:hypothetical protein
MTFARCRSSSAKECGDHDDLYARVESRPVGRAESAGPIGVKAGLSEHAEIDLACGPRRDCWVGQLCI